MAVVAYDHGLFGLVGKVEETGLNSSVVIPITNSRCFVAARLQNSRNEGLVSGADRDTSNLLMKYVNKKAASEMARGELVVTFGNEFSLSSRALHRSCPSIPIRKITIRRWSSAWNPLSI